MALLKTNVHVNGSNSQEVPSIVGLNAEVSSTLCPEKGTLLR